MIREIAVFLCAAGVVAAGGYTYRRPVPFSTRAPALDVSTVQSLNAIPLEAKILQSYASIYANTPSEVNEALDASTDEQVQVPSPGITYSISPAVVKTISGPRSEPVAKKVRVEAHRQVTIHPPSATHVISDSVSAAQTVEQTVIAPVEQTNSPPFVSVTAYPPATVASSTLAPEVQTIQNTPVQVANTVSAVPVAENKVTIEAHRTVIAHPPPAPRPVQVETIVSPAVEIVSSSVAQNVPRSEPVIVQETVTAASSNSYITSTPAPQPISRVQTVINSPAAFESTTVKPISRIYSAEEAPNPQYETRYIPPGSNVVVNSPAVQQVFASGQPVPVPVIYSAEEAPNAQYFTKYIPPTSNIVTERSPVAVSKPNPVAVSRSNQVADSQSNPVAVSQPNPFGVSQPNRVVVSQPFIEPFEYTNNVGYIPYNPRYFSPLVYSRPSLVTTHITPGFGGYARAISYSPATSVSSVSFNGLGVSYGW